MTRDARVWLSPRLSREETGLKDELMHSLVNPEVAAELRGYVEDCFRRLLTTLDLVPAGGGRVLELGANPYFFTLLLKRFRGYELELANFFGRCGEEVQHVVDERTGVRHEFRYREFNIEEDEFPYPDAAFDGVLYCEILEHLVRDPIAVFAEIHRVLKPSGWLIVTTPNVSRRQNVTRLVRGLNTYDPYSGYGPYGRHNREYTASELRELLSNTGFDVERLFTRDIHPAGTLSRGLAVVMGANSGYNLYAVARRGAAFRWYYPGWLFRSGGVRRRIRDPFVQMGFNDAVQLGDGWWDAERWGDGFMRWTRARAELFLRARGGERGLRMLLFGGGRGAGGPRTVTVSVVGAWSELPATLTASCTPGAWSTVDLALPAPPGAGEVRVTLDTPTFVPHELSGGGDRRALGVGVRSVELRA